MIKYFIAILVLILFSWSCEKTEEISVIPEVKFKSFTVGYKDYGDFDTKLTGTLSFDFIDGNGDLGFLENTDSISDNNITDIFITEYYKENGAFLQKAKGPYLLPYYNEGIYRKNIKGQIEVYLIREATSPDTVYYEFHIIDRENNSSNIETTQVFIYSELVEQ